MLEVKASSTTECGGLTLSASSSEMPTVSPSGSEEAEGESPPPLSEEEGYEEDEEEAGSCRSARASAPSMLSMLLAPPAIGDQREEPSAPEKEDRG